MKTTRQVSTFQCDEPGCNITDDVIGLKINKCKRCNGDFCYDHIKRFYVSDIQHGVYEHEDSLGYICSGCQKELNRFMAGKSIDACIIKE